jgi:DNA-binding NtrC family response regulator
MTRAVPLPAAPAFRFPQGRFTLDELECSMLEQALELCGNNQSNAARLLGLTRYAFRYRCKKHGIVLVVYARRVSPLDSPTAMMEL